jgi:indole-3-glycerol phosphate synthase
MQSSPQSGSASAKNILDTIVEQKRREIALLPQRTVNSADIAGTIRKRSDQRNFAAALRNPNRGPVALIAEVKKASPSAGLIRPGFDPVQIAREYEAAGATCLSVLTDEKFFQGSLDYLKQIRAAVKLPLLRKDFIIDELQILEAAEWGADAILLIVAILDDSQLRHFHELAAGAGLSVLVEVHDEPELDRALAAGATLVGVNNRNLKNFTVDLATTERLAEKLWKVRLRQDSATLLVAESGIHTHVDVQRLAGCGAGAILVGESLMRSPDLGAKVCDLLGA